MLVEVDGCGVCWNTVLQFAVIASLSGNRAVISQPQFGRPPRRPYRPWPAPPAFASNFSGANWCVVVDWVLKDGSGFAYSNCILDGPTATEYAGRLFGSFPSSQPALIGGKFYNAVVRPMMFQKL